MRRTIKVVSWSVIVAIASMAVMFLSKMDRSKQLDEGIVALKIDDGATALRKLTPLAETGDEVAQGTLGEMYATGIVTGIPKNDDLAIRWFRAAGPMHRDPRPGEDPAAEAEYYIGRDYLDGTYGNDPVEGRKWLNRAAKGGSREAAEMLKNLEK